MKDGLIFFTVSQIKVMTALHLLKEAGIEAYKVDKMDSAHAGLFGNIEIYVPKDKEEEARSLLFDAEIL